MCSATQAGTAKFQVFIENERVKATEWRFVNPGDNTGWHTHEYDYVVVPLQDGILVIEDSAGNVTQASLKKGVPYFRDLGVHHDVRNGNDYEFAFMEIELLEKPKK